MVGIIGGGLVSGQVGQADSGKGWIAFDGVVATSVNTFNLPIGGGTSTGSDEDRSQRPMPTTGKLKRFSVSISLNGLLAITLVIRKNGADTALIHDIPASTNGIFVIAVDVPFVKDDLISVQLRTGAGAIAIALMFVQMEMD